jgi:hypothetical protein
MVAIRNQEKEVKEDHEGKKVRIVEGVGLCLQKCLREEFRSSRND